MNEAKRAGMTDANSRFRSRSFIAPLVLLAAYFFYSQEETKSVKISSENRNSNSFVHFSTTKERNSSLVLPSLPPFSHLIAGCDIRSDVSWLLDFAVVGMAKSGTTFLMEYLGETDEIYIKQKEMCGLSSNKTTSVVWHFYQHLENKASGQKFDLTFDGRRVKTGLKCPKDIGTEDGLRNYAKFFPKTKLIVTLRHPVLWFQSFYNYRSYKGSKLPPPKDLIGSCIEGSPYICAQHCGKHRTENVCTDRAKVHHQLSRLGKTPMTTKDEMKLLRHDMDIIPSDAQIFLSELEQFSTGNDKGDHFGEDLSNFLGLNRPLPPLGQVGGQKRSYHIKERRSGFIDICSDEHKDVRTILVKIGKESATWIREYFLKSPDVFVSSEKIFLELIERWGQDPCATV
uniref:Sulfotransferase domain-containing protein n=1 Tax=Trieres chinensis TaxID=1514140 RepID=A0A7S1ZHH5_TRICV|mmetsp:Transcript_25449/g.52059  ORF Transcript_25449/g.52059 Transcript_25449/m.52059 type:complete len:399 (+) Transcript_25449:27-1223(+)